MAVKMGFAHIAKYLISRGADVSCFEGSMGGPLHLACYKVQPWLVKEIIKSNVDVNQGEIEGNTPLHLVLSMFDKNPRKAALIADMLIAAGALVNQTNIDNWAAIHLAARRG
jgi:serine/threonine-protein phosphatase 6 regulatory ankyrin repeat subunit A